MLNSATIRGGAEADLGLRQDTISSALLDQINRTRHQVDRPANERKNPSPAVAHRMQAVSADGSVPVLPISAK